jgi:hypothetical protein
VAGWKIPHNGGVRMALVGTSPITGGFSLAKLDDHRAFLGPIYGADWDFDGWLCDMVIFPAFYNTEMVKASKMGSSF